MRVLFVCTGNTCRSPMAEGLFRRLASEAGREVEVSSAGVSAFTGSPFAEQTLAVLKERQASVSGTSTMLTPELVEWADWIFVMTMEHKHALISQFPGAVEKVHRLKEFVNDDPQLQKRQSELDKLYVEAETKRAQFFAEHQPAIDALEARLRESEQEEDRELDQQLEQLQRQLRELTREEEERIRQLEADLPNHDISDPFGGTMEDYRQCADELESALRQLLRRLPDTPGG